MKILICTMTCGEGHNSFAKAVYEKCVARGHECEVFDIFSYGKAGHDFNDKGFTFLIKYLRGPYSLVWEHQLKRRADKRYVGIFINSLKKLEKEILKKLNEYKPDVIFCTHYYASTALTNLQRHALTTIPYYVLLTDYYTYPNMEASILAEKIFVPSVHSIDGLIEKGFTREQIVVSGLPVKEIFNQKLKKEEARAELGVENKFTVVVLSGSNGELPSRKLLKRLDAVDRDIQILYIAGKNKLQFKEVESAIGSGKLKRVKAYGFVTNINVFYSAADCVVTKASGGTLAETSRMRVPVVIREKMIINEKYNEKIFSEAGAAVPLNKLKDVGGVIRDLFDHGEKLVALSEAMTVFDDPASLDIIVDEMTSPRNIAQNQ